MKDRSYKDFDREKKIKKVEKSSKVVKHRKNIYNYMDEDELDDDVEQYLDEVEQYQDTK